MVQNAPLSSTMAVKRPPSAKADSRKTKKTRTTVQLDRKYSSCDCTTVHDVDFPPASTITEEVQLSVSPSVLLLEEKRTMPRVSIVDVYVYHATYCYLLFPTCYPRLSKVIQGYLRLSKDNLRY